MRLSPSGLISFGFLDKALAPGPDPRRVAHLTELPYAHRGLHKPDIVENSRAAFRAAIDLGHGIELDVQASRDGDAFVFHDADLGRLTEETGQVASRSSADLRRIRLKGSDETIPDLPEVLRLIGGRVPLLIEVKAPDRKVVALCLSVFRALDGYRGPVGVMSFNPEVSRWLARHAPRIKRGLVVTEQGKRRFRRGLQRRLALWRARPDFLAYDIRDLPTAITKRARARGMPVLTWTCRAEADHQRAALHADQIIYEMP